MKKEKYAKIISIVLTIALIGSSFPMATFAQNQSLSNGEGFVVSENIVPEESITETTEELPLVQEQIPEATSSVKAVDAGEQSLENITPMAAYQQVPSTPKNLKVTPGNKEAKIEWDAPENDGGSKITGYQVKLSGWGNQWITVGKDVKNYTFKNLENGREYTFQVRALNSRGVSRAVSVKAIPATTPDVPRYMNGIIGSKEVVINWTEPESDGGSPLTGYQVRIEGEGSQWIDLDLEPHNYLFTGLENGVEYIFNLRAVNAYGEGPIASVKRTPATTPDEVQNLISVYGNKEVTLTWESPENNGGRSITGYEVSKDNGLTWEPIDKEEYTFINLENDTAYDFCVRAVNGCGKSLVTTVTATPKSDYTYRTLVHSPTGITVSGYFKSEEILNVTEACDSGHCAVCQELSSKKSSSNLHALHNINVEGGYKGDLEIMIPIGTEHNGKKFTLLHCADGVRDERVFTGSDGVLKGTFSSLSPFGIEIATTVTPDDSKDGTKIVTPSATGELDSTTSKSANGLPKKGNTMFFLFGTVLLMSGILFMGTNLRGKKKDRQ